MAFNSVSAAAWNSVLAEHYRIAGNIKGELPKHTHEQYQIGISFTDTRTYLYRRGVYPVRPGSLSVIFPGEVHGGGGLPIRDHDTDVFTLYIPAEVVQDQEEQYTDLVSRIPPFVDPVFNDSKIAAELVKIHGMIIAGAATLQAETLWQDIMRKVFRFPSPSYSGQPESAGGVRQVREYLDAHATERVTLTELSSISKLTPYHLSRAFHAKVGISLHRYQMQRRVDLAKRLLLTGMPAARVALECGFANQSHLGRYFRPIVQVGPVGYQTAKS